MNNERVYSGGVTRLRSPERLARLEVDRVVTESLAGLSVTNALDVGTGSGVFAQAFSAQGLAVAGVDLSPEMLAAARDYVPAGDFREGRMEQLPFNTASFDLVCLALVLHEADDLAVALKEAHRVARKRVVVLEWPYEDGEMGPPLDHRLPQQTVTSAATEAGFTRVEVFRLAQLVLYRLEV